MPHDRTHLFAPGPTVVPERVLAAMARAGAHHRTPEFEAVLRDCTERLRPLFGTAGDVVLLTGAGTLAMEAAVTNFLRDDQPVLVVDGGKFGERWWKLCKAYGVPYRVLELPWGHAADPAAIAATLRANPSLRAVLCTANESSTGTWNPVSEIARVCREAHDVLCVVDAVSCLGAVPISMDTWGIDVLVAASQKALMTPPGLAFVAASERAWRRHSNLPRFYADLRAERVAQATGKTVGTPAIHLVFALQQALAMLEHEGLDAVFRRHSRLAFAVREGLAAIGFGAFSRSPSRTVTAVHGLEGFPTAPLIARLRERRRLIIANGQDRVKDRIVRIGHMGHVSETDVFGLLGTIELSLIELGASVNPGAGAGAAISALARLEQSADRSDAEVPR